MKDKLYQLTAHEIAVLIRSRQVSAREVAESFIDRIDAVDKQVNAYVTKTPEQAFKQADAVDEAIGRGEEVGILAGVPGAIKDNVCTKGVLTTCSSKSLANYIPVYDATVIERLHAAGFALVGKTNLDEFAMGSSTETSAYSVSHNPWDLECVPGGSSGGSAAAVAADECAFALGSDTAGSARQPASFCGVVGLLPTNGRVSRSGVVPLASSMDQVGPITKNVTDSALVLSAIAGKDHLDSLSIDAATLDFMSALVNDVKGLKIGVVKEYFEMGVEADVEKAVRAAIDVLTGLGAECREVSLPHALHGMAAYTIISAAESSSNMAKIDGVRFGCRNRQAGDWATMFDETRGDGFGIEVKQRIILGTYLLSAVAYEKYFVKAQKVRTLVRRDIQKAFEEFDVLVGPTSPTAAFKIGRRADDVVAMKYSDACTAGANLAGVPSISVPCGFVNGLPVGLQIVGKALDEETLLRVAYTYEQNTEWHKKKPVIG
ncbi:MAG: Asp-tRNA(Asn)/Glu-tRNA(Gln) amidotransferase subunit GatA [Armatimonadota bacterium]